MPKRVLKQKIKQMLMFLRNLSDFLTEKNLKAG